MLVVILLTIMIISIVIHVSSRQKKKYHRATRPTSYRTLRPLPGPLGFGSWYYGAWDVRENLNESIEKGREQSAHQPPLHYSHHKQGKHHHKHH